MAATVGPMAVGEHDKPSNSYWVFELFETLLGHLNSCTEAVGLTVPQAKLIGRLGKPQRISDLADMQKCDVSSMTTLLQRLERDGYVERTVDPEDARARLVSLTAQGREVRASFLDMVGSGGPGAVAQISPQTRKRLLDILGNIE